MSHNLNRILFYVLIIGFFLIQVCGCTNNPKNYVKIISVTPKTLEPLTVGESVEFEVVVEYEVSSVPATIGLNIQKGEIVGSGADAVLATKDEVVLQKKAVITLKQRIQIPDTISINIFTPLNLEGQVSTRIVDTRIYKVIKKNE